MLRGAPPGAVVKLGDQILGEAPGPILLPYGDRPLQLSVAAPGFGPKLISVTPDAPRTIALPSDKTSRPPKHEPLSHDLENPF
jgi:hypothetical protein